jgi:hypothetical protein
MPSQATIHEAEPAVAASQAQPIQSKSQGLHHTQAQPAQTQTPFAPILLDQKTRAVHGPSNVLVNLRFAFSLDENPNTHEITVTLDTLRPAGGRLLAFIDHLLRPQSLESETSPDDMTEGSSAEESDLEGFEYDNRDSIMQTEYLEELKFGSALQITPTMPNMPSLPSLKDLSSRMAGARERQAVQYTDGGNTAPLSIRGRAHRPRSSTIHAPVPAGVARGTPFTRAPAPTHDSHMSPISPADVSESVTANIIQGNDTLTELWILLQRDAAAWHTIAARLCSGSWPEMAGRRRRVENECRWAGMESLLDELAAMPSSLRGRGGFL